MNMLLGNRSEVQRGTTLYRLKDYAPPRRIQPFQSGFSGLGDTRVYHYLIYSIKRLPQLNAADESKITNKRRARQRNAAFMRTEWNSLLTQQAFSLLFHISIALVV